MFLPAITPNLLDIFSLNDFREIANLSATLFRE